MTPSGFQAMPSLKTLDGVDNAPVYGGVGHSWSRGGEVAEARKRAASCGTAGPGLPGSSLD